jgi:predicted MPP superfamily phosphohydrolase
MHLSIFFIISKALALSDYQKKYLIIVLVIGAFSFILGEIAKKIFQAKILNIIENLWLGILSISFAILLITYLLIMILYKYKKPFIITSFVIIFMLTIISILNGLKLPVIKTIEIYYNNLPEKLENFRIIQISDLHLGGLISEKRINKIIDKINNKQPDIIVITGDLIDRNICKIDKICTPFLKLKSKYGVFAVSGNHDIYTGYNIFLKWSKENNIRVVDNSLIKVNDNLEIAGIKDNEYNIIIHESDIKELFDKFSNGKFTIFLSHRPIKFKTASEKGVNLQLSGHTHNGQIPPINALIKLLYKYPYGLYKFNKSYLYTSSGTATWGPPMRLFSHNEIVQIILKRG